MAYNVNFFNEVAVNVSDFFRQLDKYLRNFCPLTLIAISIGGTIIYIRLRLFYRRSEKSLYKRLLAYGFSWLRIIPVVSRKINAELAVVRSSLAHSIHGCDKQLEFIRFLPTSAMSADKIGARAADYLALNRRFDIAGGRVSGAVYTDLNNYKHITLLTEIFKTYAFSNPLHPDVFPGCRKMEAEVVRIIANLFHGPEDTCGTMTSGGTESIILACFAYRNRAIARGIADPLIIVPATAHAAFDKAAHLMGIRIRHVPVDPLTNAVDVAAMAKAISSDTCVLVGSAPNFPTGTVDNIEAIAKLGKRYNIPVHVDACLGGFLVVFAEEIGYELPRFDFRVDGITSISCDTHKYGYAPKGTSTILYRSPEYLHYQFFSVTDWPGGIYATPTLSGSRAGLNIALTWATLLHFGRDGYVKRAKKICDAAKSLAKAISEVPGIEIVGRVDVSVVSFRSTELNIYDIGDALNELGWNLNTLQAPDSIHFCLTYNQASQNIIDEFVLDLRTVCVKISQLLKNSTKSQTAGIYGMAAQIPDKSLVDEVVFMYLDSCYSTPNKID